jgi:FtsZ-binding cell division protein ZapB
MASHFMGVSSEDEATDMVAIAMGKSMDKLSIYDFVRASGFVIDETMFDHFWQVVATNNPPHVGGVILNWLGYSGDPNKQREKFVAYLKRNEIAYLEITHTDKRARDYPSIQQEMLTKPRQIGQCKWLVMKSRDFKKAIMKLSTKRGDAIREYYLNVEDLLRLYVEYDKRFELRQREEEMKRVKMEKTRLEILLDEIKTQNDKLLDEAANASRERNTLISQNNDLQQDVTEIGRRLGAACEERAPRPLNVEKRERFVLFKWTNLNYHRNVKNPRPEDNHRVYRYYAIRAQIVSIAQALRVQRLKDPMLNVILEIDVQPNTKALYNNIKEALMEDGVRFIRNGCSLIDSIVTEQQLIERMTEVNDEKYNA